MSTKAYKGFDKDLRCRGFQYEIGKKYETDMAKICESGFHACECPLHVFEYYAPADGSRYCEVEQSGEKDSNCGKTVSTKIKIGAEIGIVGLVRAHIEWVWAKITKKNTNISDMSAATTTEDMSAATNTGNLSAAMNTGNGSAATNTGYCSAAMNTGNRSAATNTGDMSAATNTGNRSAATNTGGMSAATTTGDMSAAMNTGNGSAAEVRGRDSVAIVTGQNCRARGALGCWLVLTERSSEWHILGMKAICIDDKKYKTDTWYELKDGIVVEWKEDIAKE